MSEEDEKDDDYTLGDFVVAVIGIATVITGLSALSTFFCNQMGCGLFW